jgi:chemotaxis protein methyltransferase WspC
MNALKDIKALLEERTGWEAATLGRNALRGAVRRRMEKNDLPSEALYREALIQDPREFAALIESLVVPETWFFRDPKVFRFLGRHAAEQWAPRRARGPIRILSAPCSSGEEPYSIAMTLLESGLGKMDFTLEAVDISERLLEAAQRGVYQGASFRRDAPCDCKRHFDEETSGAFRIKDHLRETVQFRLGNLAAPGRFLESGQYDLVFCRNLIIYLKPDCREKLLNRLRKWLADDGMLFVGHAEGAACVRAGFQLCEQDGAFFFKGSPARDAKRSHPTSSLAEKSAPESFVARPAPQHGSNLAATAGEAAFQPRNAPSKAGASAPAGEAVDPLEAARRMGDAGRLAEAEKLCEDQISQEGPSAEAFFLTGVVQIAAGNQRLAEAQFQKAAYLNPRHVESLRYLALLAELRGDTARAGLCRQRLERAIAAEEEKE